MLKLYNTLSRTKEEFKPIKEGEVKLYCCGPTVYYFAHIGNLRTYIFEDVLRRVLEYDNYKVEHVMNITDVGHLTDDADEGEDKMIKAMRREGKSVWDIAQFYTEAFFTDATKLGILKPTIICKATDHIPDMIELIKRLEKKGYTYVMDGNVYFDVRKFQDYPKLAKLKLEDQKAGARVEIDKAKRSPYDFVLWFTRSKFENQIMQWDSPWGRGFPGWHIECSAMSMRYLGDHFDIHCGGIDHIPVHHTNEIAQSQGATGETWVNYWLHGEWLVIDKEKMSKSKGDVLTISYLQKKGYDPLAYRYLCLGAHYRSKLNFSWEAMDTAQQSYDRFKNKVLELRRSAESKPGTASEQLLARFHEAIDDDLNMPIALAIAWEVFKADIGAKEKLQLLEEFDKVLGLDIKNMDEELPELSEEQKALLKEREQARKNKDWEKADRLRDQLKAQGIELVDGPEGVRWRKA